MRDMTSTIDGNNIRVISGDMEVSLKLSSMNHLALGPTLKLERWNLVIEFGDHTAEQREAFMKTFERAFHRGGG